MNFRLAVMQDLQELKDMYRHIVKSMDENNIQIWDDSYPCEFFEEDIKNHQLYVLFDEEEMIAAFALCDWNAGEKEIQWKDNSSKALYLDRLGVNIKYCKKGIGSLMLTKAKEITKSLGSSYLRLFVVDINKPAIQLYIKNGFVKAKGAYDEVFEDGFALHEYGYEVKL